jgi:hypothetical protein
MSVRSSGREGSAYGAMTLSCTASYTASKGARTASGMNEKKLLLPLSAAGGGGGVLPPDGGISGCGGGFGGGADAALAYLSADAAASAEPAAATPPRRSARSIFARRRSIASMDLSVRDPGRPPRDVASHGEGGDAPEDQHDLSRYPSR